MNAPAWYAGNARSLLENRKQGLTPTGPVIVSLVGESFPQTTLHARPDVQPSRFDWRMLVNLEVWVWANASAPIDWIAATVWQIAQARPKELALRFEHGEAMHDVDCGTGFHRPGIGEIPASHEFFWQPVCLSSTALGRRITTALTAQHKKGQFL